MTPFIALLFLFSSANAFAPSQYGHYRIAHTCQAKKGDDVEQQQAFPVGTFVEFVEKKRVHIGKILSVEHKSNGGARYDVDSGGKHYGIADKAVSFAMPCPNTPGKASKLYQEFEEAQQISEKEIQVKLDISAELLVMAWEEAIEEDESHEVTPDSLIELIHSHKGSAIEKYMAWKLLRSDMAHVFFKDLKNHGRVVAFKAKAPKAVEAAKDQFCQTRVDEEICFT